MKLLRSNLILISILFLALFLRLIFLGTNRPGLTNDEAAIGYNAYSILQTGRDEHGELMPIVFKSFGDWKPGLYIYTVVPSVAVFGLTEFAVRFPNAIFGVMAIFLIYLITNYLFKNRRIALFTAFFLAISPWHIHFSRGAWEASFALTLLLAGTYFFLGNSKKYNILLSALFFALSLWAYQSAKLASVLLLLGLLVFFKNKLLKINKKYLGAAFVLGLLLSMPIALSIVSGKGGRIEVMSVFSYTRSEKYIQESILDHEDISRHGLFFNTYHPENFNLLRGVMGRYFNNFSGRYLFFEGDWSNTKHTSPNIGYMLLLDLPLLIAGSIFLARNIEKREYKFVLYWLATAPLAAALTRDSIHGVRSLNLVIPLVIISALGANYLVKNYHRLLIIIFGLVYLYNFLFYLDAYHIHAKINDSEAYSYGHKLAVEKVLELQETKDEIIFAQGYDQPYIYFLFHQKYDPKKYQQQDNFEKSQFGDVGLVTQLDNIKFRNINWSGDKLKKGSVIVGRFTDIPLTEIENNPDYKYEVINYLNSDPAFYIVEII